MTALTFLVRDPSVPGLRPERRPTLWVNTVALAAAVLLVVDALPAAGAGHHGADHGGGSLLRDWAGWSLMVTAMMLPLVAPVVCRAAAGGLWARRRRTVAEYLLGYLTPWLVVGLVGAVVVRTVLPHPVGDGATVAALVVAAAWHVAPPRRRVMSRCGAVQPGALRGRRATVDAVRNGGVLGLRCIATCLPAMTVMLLSHQLLLMAAIAVVLWSERVRGPNPAERVAHPAQAGALLALAGAVAVG
jgi:predicted metal-binding membrane protein